MTARRIKKFNRKGNKFPAQAVKSDFAAIAILSQDGG